MARKYEAPRKATQSFLCQSSCLLVADAAFLEAEPREARAVRQFVRRAVGGHVK